MAWSRVVGTGTDGGHRRLHVGVGGNDDDGHVLATPNELFAELDAAHSGHVHVGDRQPEVLPFEERDGLMWRCHRGNRELTTAQLALENLAKAKVVVDDEDAAFHA